MRICSKGKKVNRECEFGSFPVSTSKLQQAENQQRHSTGPPGIPVTYYLLPVTYYLLPVTYYLLPVTYYLLLITYYLLLITCYLLPITCYLSLFLISIILRYRKNTPQAMTTLMMIPIRPSRMPFWRK